MIELQICALYIKVQYIEVKCIQYIANMKNVYEHNLEQDAREAMRVVFSVLTKRICMHKTTFVRINSNIVLKVILNCMNMQIATQLIMMYNL